KTLQKKKNMHNERLGAAAAACRGRIRARQILGRPIRRRAARQGSPVTMRKAGAWFPWQIHGIRGSWAERRMEIRERRRKKGGEVRCPRQELAGAVRRRTGAGDGGIQSRPVGRHQPGQGWRTNLHHHQVIHSSPLFS
uniref:Uncharacterized protein n=1 Tax=Aegilops tauschii subsp. strangulata TaxID=200361 RepID=A0A453DU31_AEGTS